MEPLPFEKPERTFANPQEEIEFLRKNLAKYENPVLNQEERHNLVSKRLKEYSKVSPDEMLHDTMKQTPAEQEAIILDLIPETHDSIISELIHHLHEKGVLQTLKIVDKMNNSHIEDDFHRFLIEYIRTGHMNETGIEKTPFGKSLRFNLLEVAIPTLNDKDEKRPLKELISGMEQFYAGMLSVSGSKSEDNHISIEIANSDNSSEFVFYISVPQDKVDLLEKQLVSVFPLARTSLHTNDYNVFNEKGQSSGSYATLARKAVYPIKTYDQYDQDPLSVVLNVFSKLKEQGEGAAIQLIFKPGANDYHYAYSEAVNELRKGKKKSDALDIQVGNFGKFWKETKKIVAAGKTKDDKEKEKPENDAQANASLIEILDNKIKTQISLTNLRIVASAETKPRADNIISEIESAFNQFAHAQGNNFVFKRVSAREELEFFKDFSYRLYRKDILMPLSLREVTTIMHFPTDVRAVTGQLKQSKAGTAPAPVRVPSSGVILGINNHRGSTRPIFMTPEDRLRHLYVVGQTGTGKSTLLRKLIIQDIQNGEGVCFIDPHGSDVEDILSHIPRERFEDVIYFNPSHTEMPMSLNMLEYDQKFPEQKTFVVNEMLSIFNKLFDMKIAGGPMFEQYFRNATMLVIEDPDSGNTLLEISRVLADKKFRDMKLSRCRNPLVIQFWREIAEKAGGEGALQNIVPYITSKFDVFLSNDIMRPIVAQEKSSFNFREVMDEKKILLVNLAKGRLGDINSSLLGLIIVGKILMAALSRVDTFGKNLPPFYLYVDEFQNVTTDSISTILSEARKYRLSLTVAHQFIAQLEEKIKDSVFGNVGSMVVYRVGAEDAEVLEKRFAPVFNAHDLMNIENLNAYIKMLAHGEPVSPFNIKVDFPPGGDKSIVEPLKELSYLKYGKDRTSIEQLIQAKYNG